MLNSFPRPTGLSDGGSSKESAANARNARNEGFIPGSGWSPGAENGNWLQYPCLENPKDRGTRWVTVPGGRKEQTLTHKALKNVTPTLQLPTNINHLFFSSSLLPWPLFFSLDKPSCLTGHGLCLVGTALSSHCKSYLFSEIFSDFVIQDFVSLSRAVEPQVFFTTQCPSQTFHNNLSPAVLH